MSSDNTRGDSSLPPVQNVPAGATGITNPAFQPEPYPNGLFKQTSTGDLPPPYQPPGAVTAQPGAPVPAGQVPLQAMQQPVMAQPGMMPPYQGMGYPGGYPQASGYPQAPGYPQPGYYPNPAYTGQPMVQPVGHQPAQNANEQWMERPEISGCPPGLEYLSQVDQLVIKQQIEIFEVMTGWETPNKYKIYNSLGQLVYNAVEFSGVCMRQCCGPSRGFVINITDNLGQPVMSVERTFKCCAGCCWCACSNYCAFNVAVSDREGNLLGHMRQECSSWKPKFSITLADGNTVGNVGGPCCPCACPGMDVGFEIFSPETGDQIGQITKQWSGFGRELFTDADIFSVSFPKDLSVQAKACYLGGLFLIDFMYYEQNNQNNNRRRHRHY